MRETFQGIIPVLSLLLSIAVGCADVECPEEKTGDPISVSRDADGLKLTVMLAKDVFKAGEPVGFTFTILNNSDVTWERTFNDAGIARWDIYRDGEKVFTWNRFFGTAAVITEFRLDPGESKVYTVDNPNFAWNQKDDDGAAVPPGTYELELRIHELPEPYRLRIAFRIASN